VDLRDLALDDFTPQAHEASSEGAWKEQAIGLRPLTECRRPRE
jgi:hypothetical protein